MGCGGGEEGCVQGCQKQFRLDQRELVHITYATSSLFTPRHKLFLPAMTVYKNKYKTTKRKRRFLFDECRAQLKMTLGIDITQSDQVSLSPLPPSYHLKKLEQQKDHFNVA